MKWRNIFRWLVVCASAMLATLDAPAADISREADQIVISGGIASGDYERFAALLPGASRLVLTSNGGNLADVLKIAQAITDTAIPIRVKGVCSGDCATMLFLAARHRMIEKDGLIAFSMTSMAYQSAVLEEERTFNAWQGDPTLTTNIEDKSRQLEQQQKRLSDIHLKRGVSQKMIRLINRLTAPAPDSFLMGMTGSTEGVHELFRNMILMTSTPGRGYEYFGIFMGQAKCAYWTPDESQLSVIGIKLAEPYSRPWPWTIRKLLNLDPKVKTYPGNIFNRSSIELICDRKITLE